MNEKLIQRILYSNLSQRGRLFTVPNISQGYGEADLLSVTKGMFSHEYEIKISRSDFQKDFTHKRYKHRVYSGELSENCERRPNHFWYVAPEGLLTVEDVPCYAGLIEVCMYREQRAFLREPKKAPKLHKKKIEQDRLMAMVRGIEWRYWRAIDPTVTSPNQGGQ